MNIKSKSLEDVLTDEYMHYYFCSIEEEYGIGYNLLETAYHRFLDGDNSQYIIHDLDLTFQFKYIKLDNKCIGVGVSVW